MGEERERQEWMNGWIWCGCLCKLNTTSHRMMSQRFDALLLHRPPLDRSNPETPFRLFGAQLNMFCIGGKKPKWQTSTLKFLFLFFFLIFSRVNCLDSVIHTHHHLRFQFISVGSHYRSFHLYTWVKWIEHSIHGLLMECKKKKTKNLNFNWLPHLIRLGYPLVLSLM